MSFSVIACDPQLGFCLGVETHSTKFFLSIPVGNALVDYEEYYEISPEQFKLFQLNNDAARDFAELCTNRKIDNLLILLPGADRGSPR